MDIADVASIVGGAAIAAEGVVNITAGAVAAAPTGGTSLILAAEGVAQTALGSFMSANGAKNLGKNNYGEKKSSSNASKPDHQTISGKAADQHGNKLGPSGKPQVNKVKHSTQKSAKNVARAEGKGKPVKHSSPKKGNQHYHATDKKGIKKPFSTHHEYPPK